jgi:hypothetical protein
MPSILNIKGYRFFFFSLEGNEPYHIHIEKNKCYAKFWLNPVELVKSKGFRMHELSELAKIVENNKQLFREKWDEFFSNKV